jgi:hypothetical protein
MAVKIIFQFFILAVPLMILFPGFSHFIYPAGSNYSDLTITHLPNLVYLKNSLTTWGVIPLWTNTIFSGYPFAANPLSGLWYPFTWLLLLLPQPFGYNLVIFAHLLFGGWGVWLLLRRAGKGILAASIGAVTFELMPKLLAHYTAGHVTLVFAVCFTPWLILAEMNRRTMPGKRWIIAPGVLLGWIALADIRWLPYAGFVWLVVALDGLLLQDGQPGLKQKFRDIKLSASNSLSKLAGMFLQFLIAVGISAPLLLPLIQFSSLSTRSNMETADRLAFSLPPTRLLGLVFPDFGGYSEWVLYPGIFPIFAFIVILSVKAHRKSNWLWLLLIFISIFIALGSNNPLMPFISRLPGYDYLRVPTRALFLGGLALSMLAGTFADLLFSRERKNKIPVWPVFAAAIFVIGLFVGYWQLSHQFNFELFWGAIFVLIFSATIFILRAGKVQQSFWYGAILLALIVLDLGSVSLGGFQLRAQEAVYEEGQETAQWLKTNADLPFRTYSPSYSIPQLAGAAYNLELADGIDPMQLTYYVEFMSKATGVKTQDYSVTLPPFETGHPDTANLNAVPDARLLGLLNVRYIISEYRVEGSGMELIEKIDDRWIYEIPNARPRAWIQPRFGMIDDRYSAVILKEIQPNSVYLSAEGPGMVVLSEIDYPGWIVKVDGQTSPVLRIGGLFRGVEIGAGQHEIHFEFRPIIVFTGLIMAAVTWISLGAWLLLYSLAERKMQNDA